ncbi:putative ABC transport system permease protein [Pseudoduganella flava]|uniref:FtsX-like permease family protein n=1 Tax=Pseudoduganella flava TaxID=871742 RepID=A0A562PP04_9BURK|nr:ABC transporter permease [Pseudoduganella flava]QGZ40731.1 FtsX-like permease family protein [Pseudoduganella flava]TWI45806.1 putative ABC transport system permease protein [Pseudoduganella flava]
MFATLRQIGAAARISLFSLPQRRAMSLAAAVAIAMVVFVLLGALALDNGFRHALDNSGSADLAIVLRAGAGAEVNSTLDKQQQDLLDDAPGVVREQGRALVSPELYMVVDGTRKAHGEQANMTLRGVTPAALAVRPAVRLAQGRMFRPGSNELVVGRALQREFAGLALGAKVRIHAVDWTVVGVLDANGSVFESEMWADLHVLQSLTGRGSSIQSLRMRLTGADSLAALRRYAGNDPRLAVDIKTEQEYYAEQAKQSSDLINAIGKPLAALMALGALAGALNTMYSSVAERAKEIATLRILGYGHLSTLCGTMLESLALALAGAAAGTLGAYLVFNGMSASTVSGGLSTLVFHMALAPAQLAKGMAWAIAIGVLGGLFPAIRAMRQPLVNALAE